jgi:shikimate dehydrogenase
MKTMHGRTIASSTKLCAIIGNPIGHSLSPLVHNAAFEHLGLDYVFLAFEVERLQEAVRGIAAFGFTGVSVTIPHKVAVRDYLDEIEPVARRIGAVNTIVNREGRLIGHNTDWSGAMKALEDRIDLRGKTAVVLGAGGAARAIAFGLKEKGADPVILNRTVSRADSLASGLQCRFGPIELIEKLSFDLVINATSVGMSPRAESTPLNKALLKDVLVFDTVYNPLKTRLIREAEERGCPTVTGLEMFVNQAALQFELWTGQKAPLDLMRSVAAQELA